MKINQRKIKNKKRAYFFAFTLLLQAVFFSTVSAQTISGGETCNSSGICTNIFSNLADGSTGVDANTTVNLNFSVYKKPDMSLPTCQGSRQLFHAVRVGVDDSAYKFDSNGNGSGNSFNFSFTAGPAGTRNYYYAVFYCWTQQNPDKSLFGTLNTQGQFWQTTPFDFTSRAALGAASISPDKTSAQMGGTINLTASNLPMGWTGTLSINGTTKSMNSSPFPLIISTDNGFKDNSQNTISVSIVDSGGGNVKLSSGANIAINIGNVPASGTTPPSAGTMASNPSDKLYNPLPEGDLTHAFLVVLQGFLGIVGIWAVMFIVIGGFQMVVASGNEEMYTKAKKTIVWAVMGLVISLLSFSIIAVVQDLLSANVKAPTSSIEFKQIASK